MDPLTNAVLGLLFIGVGVGATTLMYALRGASTRRKSAAKTPPPAKEPEGESGEKYLAAWRRPSDELESHMVDIHTIATTGQSIIEPMRTRKQTFSWDDLLVKGAQLAKVPLNEDEPVRTQTVIGPAADHPLVIETPVYVSHMSFGALSREIKIALATGSAAVGTAICSGEGGILEEEFQAARKYIFEYVPNAYSVTDENLKRVDAIEIKFGQSAKPGMGGHLPGNKVTHEIAQVRGRTPGTDITSPARFEDVGTREGLRRKVEWLRELSGGKPIGIKLAAGNIEADLEHALSAEPDFITLDGRAGATGAAPKVVKDATSIPTIFALYRARKFLTERGADQISLVITGGLRISSDFAKALALGADAVAVATVALMAAGCQQYRICNTGRCPVGITSQDPELRGRLNIQESARRLENYLR
ncbi:MAG: FMN-binding glutamate synthase family protein, partial [Planctomycetes bacterium]|nr:FMN-binding glutamate synthase family protein [Planctomycetota bacterium]